MGSYRVMAGMGVISRASTDKPDDIPVPVYLSNATSDSKTDCLHQLTKRLGAGVELSIDRTRNNNYIQELGLREFSTATSGMYEIDFSISGVFSPQYCSNWLGNAFMMGDNNEVDYIEIKNGSVITEFTKPDFSSDHLFVPKDERNVYTKLIVPGKGVEGNDVSIGNTTGVTYNKIKSITFAYYKNYDSSKSTIATKYTDEYTESDATQHVYIVASIEYVTTGTTTAKLQYGTTEATHFGNAKDAYVDFYTNSTWTTHYEDTDLDATVYIMVKNDTKTQKFGQPMLHKDVVAYKNFANIASKSVKLFGYKNLSGPKYFDFGYQKINAHASGVSRYDGHNEMGVIVGCIIESASISYESGSDAGVKFQLSCHGLRDIVMITDDQFDYASILEDIPEKVFVGGCVSVYDKTSDDYVAVAQTDSASISISNNTQRLGNCLRLNYSSYSIGSLTYDVSTSTYSNDPNKYLKYFYGYEEDMTPDGGYSLPEGASSGTPGHYFIAKQPVPIGHMKIRTDDTSATQKNASMFMDINMTDVFVGDMSNSYSVDTAIMDEPSLRPKKTYIAVGYTNSDS